MSNQSQNLPKFSQMSIKSNIRKLDTMGHLNIEEKQQLLEILSVGKRLEGILGHMEGEVGALQVEKIRGRVKRQMKTQREYYLNEQLKAIQKELGEEDGAMKSWSLKSVSRKPSCRRKRLKKPRPN